MMEYGLCGCAVEFSPSGLVLAVDTCEWCCDLGLLNVSLARNLQYGVREGREASELGDPSRSCSSKTQ